MPAFEPAPPGVTVRDDGALRDLQAEVFDDFARHRGTARRCARAIILPERSCGSNVAHGVDRHGEPDADVAASPITSCRC